LALAAGAAIAVALCGLFGLTHFVTHVGSTASHRELGVAREGGCIQGRYRYDPVNLEQYDNVLLSATCTDPPIPLGLTHFPRPGQVYLSPALAHLRNADPLIAERYPHVDGVIHRAGLTGSNELRAIIGVQPHRDGTLGVSTFDTFGSADSDYLAAYLRFSRTTLLVLGLFFTLPPAAFLIVACTRLNARVRERQLGLLSIMGIQAKVLRRALMLESAVLVGFGAVAGLILAKLVYARITPRFVTWTAFPGDFSVPWTSLLIVLVLVVGTAVVASWWGAGFWRSRPSRQLMRRAPKRLTWRWTLLVTGLVLAAVNTWWRAQGPLILAGRFITVAGLFAVAAPLCAYTGQRLNAADGPLVSLAGARLRRPSGALTRALAALISGLFVLSVGATTVQGFGENPAAIEQAQTADGYSVVEVRRPNEAVRSALSPYQVLSGHSSTSESFIGTLSGPCAVIGQVIGDHRFACSTKSLFGVSSDRQRPPTGVTATPAALIGPRADFLSGYVVNATAHSAIRPQDDIILIPLPTAKSEALYDQLVGKDPLTNVRIDGMATVSGASELVAILDVFRWGGLFAVVISLIAVLISLVSLMNDRQPGNNYLQILGVTPRHAAALALIEVMAASGSCSALALFSSWLWALANRSGDHPLSPFSVAAPFVIAALALLAAASAVVWNTLRTAGVTVVPDRDNLVSAHDTFATNAS
jgi:hypothetical protein